MVILNLISVLLLCVRAISFLRSRGREGDPEFASAISFDYYILFEDIWWYRLVKKPLGHFFFGDFLKIFGRFYTNLKKNGIFS